MYIELHPRMRDWHGWFWEVTGDVDTSRLDGEVSGQSLAEAIDNDGLAPVSAAELALLEKTGVVWISIDGIVLEVTGWRKHHPGGGAVFERRAGCDCTKEFFELGHTAGAIQIAKKFVVGRLVSGLTLNNST